MTTDRTQPDVTAERRRAIELAVQMRPEMDLVDLRRVLERLGFDADEGLLERDLDELGYDVVDDDPVDGGAEAAGDGDRDEDGRLRVDGAAPPPPRREERPTPADDGPDPERDDPDPGDEALAALAAAAQTVDDDLDETGRDQGARAGRARPVAPGSTAAPTAGTVQEAVERPDRLTGVIGVVAIVAAIVCVASLVWLFTGRSTDDAAAEAPETTTGEPPSTARSDPTTPETSTPAPVTVPPLTDPVEAMDFAETSGLLPATADGGRWVPLAGDFATADGVAISDPGANSSVAIVPTPEGDMRAEVTLPQPSDRAGLAFAVQSDRSYRAWVIDTAASTATLFLVEGTGREVEVAPVTVALPPGVVLGISVEGDTTDLLVDDRVVATAPTRGGTGVGLAALAPLAAATFDDLRVAYG